jgi:glycosyltransferase involved in cell wall biosynthesis
LRLVYVLKMFPRLSETFILNEILALEALGHRITVFSRLRHAEELRHGAFSRLRGAVHYIPVDEPGFPRRAHGAHAALRLRRPRAWREVRQHAVSRGHAAAWAKFLQAGIVAREALRLGADHIHAHFLSGNARVAKWASALSGIGYSLTAHAKDIYANPASARTLGRRLRQARGVITISEYNRAHLARLGAPPASLHVIYNGVDLDRFHPRHRRAESGAPPLILSVGRLVPKKGFSILVEACARLQAQGVAFRCAIVGGGEGESALKAQVRERGLERRVQVLGPRTQEEVVRDFYPRAAAVALPCVVTESGDRDGIPTVLIEAMAMGVPCVSTRLSGIPELIEDRVSGLLVEPGDPASLAGALQHLLSAPERCAALGAAARRRVESGFDLRANVRRLAEFFSRAAAPRQRLQLRSSAG